MAAHDVDAIVIGGGIAGAAIAAHLAEQCGVTVLEMEDHPGYHSTGRSAALFVEAYGNAVIRALTRASRDFFYSPPAGFCDEPLVTPRKVMILDRVEQHAAFERFITHELPAKNFQRIGATAATALCPALRPEGLLGAIMDTGAADIEVHALHQGYLKLLKERGGRIVLGAKVAGIKCGSRESRWTVETTQGAYRASILINAAGAWADEIGAMAGARPIGLEPRRRTAALIDLPEGLDACDWPMILDAEEQFYMKPDAGLLLISPADETLSEPEDAQADELDVAIAADRLQKLTTIEVHRIKSKWAGLRSFVKDRSPIVGYDPDLPGFFWLAALGGYGIQTAPALSSLAASLALRLPATEDFAALGIRPEDLSPTRLRQPTENRPARQTQ